MAKRYLLANSNNVNNIGTTVNKGKIDASNLRTGTGGKVVVFGERIGLLENSLFDVSGSSGGGEIQVGNIDTIATYIDPKASIKADGLNTGDGGTITILGKESIRAYGSFSARGGGNSGNGGLIATSSANFVDVAGIKIDSSSSKGIPGTWLLESSDITLLNENISSRNLSDNNSDIFTKSTENTTILNSDIQNSLNNGTNVTLRAKNGNIFSENLLINKTTEQAVTLGFEAAKDIILKKGDILSSKGKLGLILQADSDRNGQGNINLGTRDVTRSLEIQTRGGKFSAIAPGSISIERSEIESFDETSNLDSEPFTINSGDKTTITFSGIKKRKAFGNGGSINIDADSLFLQNIGFENNSIKDATSDAININLNSNFQLISGSIKSNTKGSGNAASININAQNISLKRAAINSITQGSGNAAPITINVDSISLERARIITVTENNGNTANININANSIKLNNGVNNSDKTRIITRTEGDGKTGDININAQSISLKNNSDFRNDSESNGETGRINVRASIIDAENGSGIGGGGIGNGGLGEVNVTADSIKLINRSGIGNNVENGSNAGTINITTGSLEVKDSSGIGSDAGTRFTRGTPGIGESRGNAGIINIVADSILLENKVGIGAGTSGSGETGKIFIETDLLRVKKNSGISTASGVNNLRPTFNKGQGGALIKISAVDIYLEDRSGISGLTGGEADGGDIIIQTNSLELKNQGSITTNALDDTKGNAGKIEITAPSLLIENASGISSNSSGIGNAGQIKLNVGTALLKKKSDIATSTSSSGKGGEMNFTVSSLTLLDNSKINSGTTGSGRGGNINLQIKNSLSLDNESEISVSSSPQNNNIKPGTAGDINLKSDLLLLRRGSKISTTAGNQQFGGDGGNIDITTPFLVTIPDENSDISANAFSGNGGKINITTEGIFGISPRQRLTSQSDITASSELGVQGEITITKPNVDPSRGIIELPTNLEDKSNQIGQICPRTATAARNIGKFTITGRGSLPPSPLQALSGRVNLSQLATLNEDVNQTLLDKHRDTTPRKTEKILEAQGILKGSDGTIYLIAQAPGVVPNSRGGTSVCSDQH
ncbi:MAG: S-layer family protein [Cyanobacteria bacterium P01_A01_bin.84]